MPAISPVGSTITTQAAQAARPWSRIPKSLSHTYRSDSGERHSDTANYNPAARRSTKRKEIQQMLKRKYTLAVLTLLSAATIATSWVTKPAPLIGSERTELTIAGSKGDQF